MKKFFPFILILALSFYFFVPVSVKADENYFDQFQTIAIMPHLTNDSPPLVGIMLSYNSTVICRNGWCDNSFNGNNIFQSYYYNSVSDALTAIATGNVHTVVQQDCHDPFIIIRGNISVQSGSPTIYQNINEYWDEHPDERPEPPTPPDPSEPEPGSSWLEDVWEWILWQLGINDDYSGDIDVYITGGDRERMEMVTPTPSPTPTPRPTLPPYSLDIVDSSGNSVYTITGIPNNTNNYYYSDDHSSGSDFDIFEVDLQIGDGGSVNPRDGLNEIMDTSLSYLSDPENVDMQPVGDSFSIIPNDWFLILGVVACFPFIAGFISKLLK